MGQIYKNKKGFKIKNVKGVSPTKEKAVKRLQAVVISQQEQKKKNK